MPIGLYLHIPFCARSCDFCHFYQEAPRREELDRYLQGMELSLASVRPARRIDTVFWGGGTPGLLPARDLGRLAEAVMRANNGVKPEEWTVEMAPATVKEDKLRALADAGVTRISMGVQSFAEKHLEALGRIHTRSQVDRALDLLRGFSGLSFNIDLIFAIPGQEIAEWANDLREAVACGPHHISTYCLTFEDDTALWLKLRRGEVRKQTEEDEASFHELAWSELASAGYDQYEVSNYARPGHVCIHNVNTWHMAEWIGVGPSASSQFGGRRWTEAHSIQQWLEGLNGGPSGHIDEVRLTPGLLAQDALVFGLRMNCGVDEAALRARFGDAFPPAWEEFAEDLLEAEYALRECGRFRLTAAGRLLADRIGSEFIARSADQS